MTDSTGYAKPAIAGSGAIAVGLAATATTLGEVRLLARSEASAWRAEEQAEKQCGKIEGASSANLRVTTDPAELAGCDLVVESIVEDADAKVELLKTVAEVCPEADLATTTSSLGIAQLGERAGVAERFYGLHPFNPVPRMELVELCLPEGIPAEIGERARAFCEVLGKRPVEVPDQAGFVVNRLLFPYLFDAVRFGEQTGMEPADVDACMTLGAGHPMGPLRLIDFVGIDVAVAIGRSLYEASGDEAQRPPERLEKMLADEQLGRKTGSGFYTY